MVGMTDRVTVVDVFEIAERGERGLGDREVEREERDTLLLFSGFLVSNFFFLVGLGKFLSRIQVFGFSALAFNKLVSANNCKDALLQKYTFAFITSRLKRTALRSQVGKRVS